ncbi:MAG: alpha/beta hydrolase [Cyclobacteriaceae bacterium]|nr:alpha/beta hydrolase [Cyclobacteriaceae bacterium]
MKTQNDSRNKSSSKKKKEKNQPLVGRMKFYYKNPIVDSYFANVLAFGTRGGADLGEAYAAAGHVSQYDTEAWVREFTNMGEKVAAMADEAMAKGHLVTARDRYLRAYALERAALFQLSPLKYIDRYKKHRLSSQDRFRKAISLFSHPVEVLEIPFEGKTLPGYFMKPDNSMAKRPTLIALGGGDSVCEDICLVFGLNDQDRGYNIVTVDLPGMGSTALDGMLMTPRPEKAMSVVIDYILARPDVDPDRLALWGGSLGGYNVPRVAVHDNRIKAVIANSIILNLHEYFVQVKEVETLAKYENTFWFSMVAKLFGSWLAGLYNVMDTWKWKWGVNTLAEWLEVCKEYVFDPSEIDVPILMLVGEDELAFPNSKCFHEDAMAKIKHPQKKLVVGSASLGAGGKNMLPNFSLIRETTFDWLDELFSEKKEGINNNTRAQCELT